MRNLHWLHACVVALSMSACASRPSGAGCNSEFGIAELVEVAEGGVNVAGIRFGDAVIVRMDTLVVELAPTTSGGRIRIATPELAEKGAEGTSFGAGDREAPVMFTASSVTVHRPSAYSIEISLVELTSRDPAGSATLQGAVQLVVDL